MKKLIVVIALVFVAFGAVAQTRAEFTGALDDFLVDLNENLPDNAVVGGTWSKAYIGQLLSVPPHFGVGVSFGVTPLPSENLSDAVDMAGLDLDVNTLYLPTFAIEGRIGGFILPFDIGVRIGMSPEVELMGVTLNFITFGADVRYALIDGGLIKPDLSIGLAYSYTKFELGYVFDANSLAGIDPAYGTLKEDLTLVASAHVFDLRAQLSKSFLIVTPYVGAGVSYAISESSYDVAIDSGSKTDNPIGARAYGGFSLNIALLKIDFKGMYNFISGNWGANLGARIQM